MTHVRNPVAAIVVATSVAVVTALAACGLLPAAKGEVVTCNEQWLCGQDEVASAAKKFCTDPNDSDRAAQITQFQKDFAQTCAGATETCIGGVAATCVAQCTPKGDCDINTAVPVTLR